MRTIKAIRPVRQPVGLFAVDQRWFGNYNYHGIRP